MAGTWLEKCIIDAYHSCTGKPNWGMNCAKDVVQDRYDVTGDPKDSCAAHDLAHATSVCYKELKENCKVSEMWLEMCIEDVCSALTSGDSEALTIAEGFCDNQNDLEEELNATNQSSDVKNLTDWCYEDYTDYNGNDVVTRDVALSLADTTFACQMQCQARADCFYFTFKVNQRLCWLKNAYAPNGRHSVGSGIVSGPKYCENGGTILDCRDNPAAEASDHQTKCVIRATYQQCEDFAQNVSGGPVTMQVGSWGDEFPSDCFKSMVGDQVHVWWNNNTGDGDAAIDPNSNTAYGADSCCEDSARRICCGSYFLPFTTTTTTKRFDGTLYNYSKPPVNPYYPPPRPDTIDRPANPVTKVCYLHGDPHIHPFDYAKRMRFDTYVYGNYWLVQSSSVWIQGHYGSINHVKPHAYAYMLKVAVAGPFLKGNTLMIEGAQDGAQVWWNANLILSGAGQPSTTTALQEMDGDVEIERVNTGILKPRGITAPQLKIKVKFVEAQVELTAKVFPRDEIYRASTMNLGIKMLQILDQDGQCGNFNLNYKDDLPYGIPARYGGIQNRVSSAQALIPY